MKGVHKRGNHCWRASWGNTAISNRIYKDFKTEDEAIQYRKFLLEVYGEPKTGRSNYVGFKNKYWEIISDTGKNDNNGEQLVVALNKSTNNYQVIRLQDIISRNHSGIGRPVPEKTKGVYYNKKYSKYRAQITLNWKKYYLGSFETYEEAHKAYVNAWNNFVKLREVPKKHVANSEESNITITRNEYQFHKAINGNKYTKYFKTLDDAIAYKHEFLKEHGLTE